MKAIQHTVHRVTLELVMFLNGPTPAGWSPTTNNDTIRLEHHTDVIQLLFNVYAYSHSSVIF